MVQGVIYHDAAGTVLSMNRAAEGILGLTRADLLGKSSPDVEDR